MFAWFPWPASCPSYDLAQDDESQGANTVIMFGYYAGVAVLVSVLTRGIFMHRSSHVLHFHAKINAMFASCVLLFLLMCCLESNVYLPPCPSSGEYRSDINPFKEPDKPITGACFAERVVNGFTTKVTALPPVRPIHWK